MLLSLHIENVAVVKSLDLDFKNGFTALTGETGAGKSVIIDSINLLLGKKSDKEIIRSGERAAMVSGLFGSFSEKTIAAISECGIELDDDGTLFIQRVLSADGKSGVKINGRTVGLSVLKAISEHLIDIHAQSQTYSLTDPKVHIDIIDAFSSSDAILEEYKAAYEEYDNIRKQIKNITEKEQDRLRLSEILEYQISDIDKLSLKENEEEELIEKKLKIKNSEKISKQAGFAFKALKGSEKGSVYFLVDRTISALSSLSDVIPDFADYAEKLRDMLYRIDEIAEDVYAAVEDIDSDPTEKLNHIESRLDKISKVKRKYGSTIAEVLAFRKRAAEELEELKNYDDVLERLEKELARSYAKALSIADTLHKRRIEFAKLLENQVKESLEFLDMPKVVFFASVKVEISESEKILNSQGYDKVEFFISANRGLDAQPMAKVASGGELARIMLSLKTVLADKDGGATMLVFDEIDAGVSGKTARKIGIKLLNLSKHVQIVSVTHSAQIASLADNHYLIKKSETDGTVSTGVYELDTSGRIEELSRILGGINVTDAQRAAACDMLKEKEIYND